MTTIRLLWQDPALRLASLLMIMTGTLWASFGPYVALLGVETFGLGPVGYAAVLVVAALLGVGASVAIGIRTDQRGSRRRMAIATCALAVAGLVLMVLLPGKGSFVLFHAVILPVSSTIFGQIFALTRLAAARYGDAQRQTITALIRAATSVPFVVILPLMAAALDAGVPLTSIYPLALVFSVIMLWMVWRSWPKEGASDWQDVPSGLSLRAALREVADPALALRLFALGAIAAMPTLYVLTLALILTQIGGRPSSDPGLFFGLLAGAEVPAILLVAYAGRFVPRLTLILIGSGLSAGYLLALPVLAGSPLVWALILPAALAHGVLLPVPITYLQDLLAKRPGTGTALLALQGLIGNVVAAAALAIGTFIGDYTLVMVLGAVMGLAGALVLWKADREK